MDRRTYQLRLVAPHNPKGCCQRPECCEDGRQVRLAHLPAAWDCLHSCCPLLFAALLHDRATPVWPCSLILSPASCWHASSILKYYIDSHTVPVLAVAARRFELLRRPCGLLPL